MRLIAFSVALLVAFTTVACGDSSSDAVEGVNDKNNSEELRAKRIEREEVSDNRFKPTDLEETIDELVASIAESGTDDEQSIGIVLKELNHFWRPVTVGANRALGELEVVGAVQGPPNRDEDTDVAVQEQIDLIEDQRDQGYTAYGIAPHGTPLSEVIDAIVDDGHPVITIDTDLVDSKRQLYVGTDNQTGGTTGGESLVELMSVKDGRVIILGNTDPAWADGFSRTNAAAKVVEDAGYEVQILNSAWNGETEVENVVAAIADEAGEYEKPVVGMLGVFANAHALATGALQANMEEMPTIVAFDFEPDTLGYMEEGVIAATHVQRQYYMGYLTMYLLYSIESIGLDATKDIVGDHLLRGFHVDTGLDVIRADDLAEYNAFVDELGID